MATTRGKKAKANPVMKVVGKRYANVSGLVQDSADAEFAAEFEAFRSERALVNCLTTIRCANEVGQADLSERMGCAQSKLSRMETSADADLNFGDIVTYARSLRQTIHIMFSPERKNGSDHIRFHFGCIKSILADLVELAGDDGVICNGVETLAIGQLQGMVEMVDKVLDLLPHRIQAPCSPVSIEAEGERGQRLALNHLKKPRKTKKKMATPIEV